MLVNQTAQTYIQSASRVRVHQQLHAKSGLDLPGGRQLWLAAVRLLVVAIPFFLALHFWLGSAAGNLHAKMGEMTTMERSLRDQNISLRAQKAQLTTPERISDEVARMALYLPSKNQVVHL